jgi:sugar phosphate isomerase/epimerase
LHQPCGEGVVGYDVVFDAVKSADITCPIVLEVPDEGWDASVEHLKQLGFPFGDVPDPTNGDKG